MYQSHGFDGIHVRNSTIKTWDAPLRTAGTEAFGSDIPRSQGFEKTKPPRFLLVNNENH